MMIYYILIDMLCNIYNHLKMNSMVNYWNYLHSAKSKGSLLLELW